MGGRTEGRTDGGVHNIPVAFINKFPQKVQNQLVKDFMSVPVTCMFDEDPIKNEVAIIRTTFSPLYV